jgi:hypothetical protein
LLLTWPKFLFKLDCTSFMIQFHIALLLTSLLLYIITQQKLTRPLPDFHCSHDVCYGNWALQCNLICLCTWRLEMSLYYSMLSRNVNRCLEV